MPGAVKGSAECILLTDRFPCIHRCLTAPAVKVLCIVPDNVVCQDIVCAPAGALRIIVVSLVLGRRIADAAQQLQLLGVVDLVRIVLRTASAGKAIRHRVCGCLRVVRYFSQKGKPYSFLLVAAICIRVKFCRFAAACQDQKQKYRRGTCHQTTASPSPALHLRFLLSISCVVPTLKQMMSCAHTPRHRGVCACFVICFCTARTQRRCSHRFPMGGSGFPAAQCA